MRHENFFCNFRCFTCINRYFSFESSFDRVLFWSHVSIVEMWCAVVFLVRLFSRNVYFGCQALTFRCSDAAARSAKNINFVRTPFPSILCFHCDRIGTSYRPRNEILCADVSYQRMCTFSMSRIRNSNKRYLLDISRTFIQGWVIRGALHSNPYECHRKFR